MLSFSIPISLPSGKTIRVPELSNKIYLAIIKFCENRDLEGLNSIFIEYLNVPDNLDIIDRLYLLVFYRSLFINDSIIFSSNDGKELEFNLDSILAKLESLHTNITSTITDSKYTIDLHLPTTLYFDKNIDLYNYIIHTISFNNKFIDFTKLTSNEREDILSDIPQSVLIKVNNYIKNELLPLRDIILIDENKNFNIEQYSIDILSNEPMLFVCILYSHTLLDYFNTLYGYITKISADPDFYYNLSPVESKIMLNIHNKEVERENKELKKQ
jgi:hypothetical protein